MKTLIITLLFLGLTISSYSHEDREVMKEGIMKVQDLPAVVIKVSEMTFQCIPDMNADQSQNTGR
jgi:hypothetical protein